METGGAEHAAPVGLFLFLFFLFFMGVGGVVEMLRDIGNVSDPSYLMMAVMHCEVRLPIKGKKKKTCANLRQPGIPVCISHQSASVNGRGENLQNLKILLLLCHEMPF